MTSEKGYVEWFDDERGCSGFTNGAPGKTGVELVDDITGLNPLAGGGVFHTRNLHLSGRTGNREVNFYDGAVAAGSLRWHIYVAANVDINITGLRSMRFHSTIVINMDTTGSSVLVHIGGILRNN